MKYQFYVLLAATLAASLATVGCEKQTEAQKDGPLAKLQAKIGQAPQKDIQTFLNATKKGNATVAKLFIDPKNGLTFKNKKEKTTTLTKDLTDKDMIKLAMWSGVNDAAVKKKNIDCTPYGKNNKAKCTVKAGDRTLKYIAKKNSDAVFIVKMNAM